MSGVSTGTAMLISAGIGLAATAYTVDASKSAAHKNLKNIEKAQAEEEVRVRDQMRQQEEQAAAAMALQEKQMSAVEQVTVEAKQNDSQRAAAEVAAAEAARQSDAAVAQVDVAGGTSVSRSKRRRAFFNSTASKGPASGGSGFVV